MMRSHLRVHVVPVGFEVKRVTEPVLQLKGDRVYLISLKEDDKAAEHVKKIKKALTSKQIDVKVEYTDIWNIMACMEKFREIVTRERENQIYFNVSTGSTLASIAAMLTCMIWKCGAYYAKLKYDEKKKQEEFDENDVEDVLAIPVYKILRPEDRHLLILGIIKDKGQKIRKKDLIGKLNELKIIHPVMGKKLSIHAEHSQLNAMLKPLVDEHYVEVQSRGRSSIVILTQQGENALKIFGEGATLKEGSEFITELEDVELEE
ncbi:MAG: DUF6293 family protein [Nitrosotalea sp.]